VWGRSWALDGSHIIGLGHGRRSGMLGSGLIDLLDNEFGREGITLEI
jgi:hypothetical protein